MKTYPLSSARGNVLFMILIAVGLFAALSYAVSSSFRGGTSSITDEQARIAAGELLRDMQSIKQGYDYLWNQRGCSLDDISFQSLNGDIGAVTFTDVGNDGEETCEIFNALGGGATYPNNLASYQDSDSAGTALGKFTFLFSGYEPFAEYKVEGVGTDENDHMVILQAVNPAICKAVNKLLDYADFNADIIDAGSVIGDDNTAFEGRTSGCRSQASGGPYDVFYVLQEL